MPNSSSASTGKDMRRVWLLFLGFCVPLVLGWVVLEWQLEKVPNSFSAKRDQLQLLAADVDTVILGSSEAFFGISPHHLRGSGFNLANNAQTLYYDYEIMKRVLPELPKLKRVILQIDYVTLYSEMYDNQDSWREYGYYQEWSIPLQRPIDYWNVRLVSRAALYKTLPVLLELIKGRRANFATCVDDRGWCDAPLDWADPGIGEEAGRRMVAANHSNMSEERLPANTAVLEHLFAMLRDRGIETDIVIMPITSYYRAAMDSAMWDRTEVIIKDLTRKYGGRYSSFERDPRLTAEDFNDVNHLNSRGAKRFSEILDAALGPLEPHGQGDEQSPTSAAQTEIGSAR
jgi:hypothetical protein